MDIELVDMTEGDIELVRQWRNSPDVAKYMYTEDYITGEQQQKWFDAVKDDPGSKYWMIRYNDKLIGGALADRN